MRRRTKKRVEKIQKHKGYWKLVRAFREVYGDAKDDWECKYRIKQLRGTKQDDLGEIKSLARSKRQDFYLEVNKYDSAQDYDFYTNGLIEQLQFIQKLEGLIDLLDISRDIYRDLEQEYKFEKSINESYSIEDIQRHIKYKHNELWEDGYRVSKTFLFTPNGKKQITFFDEIGWLHNKGATAFEIIYR
ncbi:hypothetical protein [Emticicia sp. BO119]|uniref:hypothetical protein n=1 Tax=Emticicia sp. BO119 TaxID=2757768 RepID=UPI0015F0A650|nr:hypothetical protein [Emticicia sp. BO119]MBA4849000.1 hypothetical protein [Emticicia sp. BO119]